jgi:polyisoprenoid-binding protein YceI
MNTDESPEVTFEPAEPVGFGSTPEVGAEATGELTIHGETSSVSFGLDAQRTAGGLPREQ